MDAKHALSKNLHRLRTAARETHADLAAALGVSPAAVSAWETAAKMPRADTLDAMAEHYGVTRDSLIASDAGPLDLDDLLLGDAPLALAGRELTTSERRLIARLAHAALGGAL